jgi:prepilin-type N-terminal cleavage/methylation domain-containing protein
MNLRSHEPRRNDGFTLAEVSVALLIALIFAGATFATNQRLLLSIRSQKETTAATLMLQERMENFRVWPYSNIAAYQFVNDNIASQPTKSEAALGGGVNGSLSETITVSGYHLATGGTSSTHSNQWVRNAQHPTGSSTDTNNSLATNYDLLKVDILITWTGAGGRTRTRDLTAVFGEGNSGW